MHLYVVVLILFFSYLFINKSVLMSLFFITLTTEKSLLVPEKVNSMVFTNNLSAFLYLLESKYISDHQMTIYTIIPFTQNLKDIHI